MPRKELFLSARGWLAVLNDRAHPVRPLLAVLARAVQTDLVEHAREATGAVIGRLPRCTATAPKLGLSRARAGANYVAYATAAGCLVSIRVGHWRLRRRTMEGSNIGAATTPCRVSTRDVSDDGRGM